MPDPTTAVERWKRAIGSEHVVTAPALLQEYANNVTAIERRVPVVLFPSSTENVQRIVEIANEYKMPLYPISRGKNWGYGSRLSVRDGCSIVDLSRMNRILEVNVRHHYAVIEPGVTQEQLCAHLSENRLPLMVDVTSAGGDSSLIGNCLERGHGFLAPRTESLSGLEVVLGNGKVVRTGYGHYPEAKATYQYKYGLGPDLTGLFVQGNFGIVTSAGMDLVPLLETTHAAHFTLMLRRKQDLAVFIDRMGDLQRKKVVFGTFALKNQYALRPPYEANLYRYLTTRGGLSDQEARSAIESGVEKGAVTEWVGMGRLKGTRRQVRESQRELKRAFRGLARVFFLTRRKSRVLRWIFRCLDAIPGFRRIVDLRSVRYGLGAPFEHPEGAIRENAHSGLYWDLLGNPSGPADPDQSECGLYYSTAIAPLEGAVAREIIERAEAVFGRYDLPPMIESFVSNDRVILFLFAIHFDRKQARLVEAAHRCADELFEELASIGIYPERVNPQLMERIVDEEDPFWQTVRDLKRVLDPNNVIAPGRYNLV